MIGAWEVASIIRFSTNGPVVMKQLANSASAANSQMGVLNGTVQQGEAKLKGLQNRMSLVRTEQLAMFTGMASMGALAFAGLSVAGISWAAQLQRSMTTVQISTGATGKSFEDLQNLVIHTSDITAQSAATIAQEMAVAATAGLSSSGRLMSSFQQLAQAVDVLWLKGGQKEDPTNLMKSLVQFQHYFGAYGGDPNTGTGRKANAKLQEVLNRTVDLEFMQPENVQKLVTQGKYFIPQAVRMGVDEDTIFRYMALLGQTGLLQGRGGTSFQQFLYRTLNPAAITSTLSNAQKLGGGPWRDTGKHLGGLGLLDEKYRLRADLLTDKGAPDVDKIISQLLAVQAKDISAFGAKRGRGTWMNDVKNFFQTQAAQVVNIFASEMSQNALKVIDATLNRMKKTGTVQEIWAAYMNTFMGAFQKFVTNLQNIVIDVFLPLLPALTSFFSNLADRLTAFDDFLRTHKDLAANIGWTILGITGALTALAVAGGVVLAANFMGIASGLTALGAAISGLATANAAAVAATDVGAVEVALAGIPAVAKSAKDAIKLFGAEMVAQEFLFRSPHQMPLPLVMQPKAAVDAARASAAAAAAAEAAGAGAGGGALASTAARMGVAARIVSAFKWVLEVVAKQVPSLVMKIMGPAGIIFAALAIGNLISAFVKYVIKNQNTFSYAFEFGFARIGRLLIEAFIDVFKGVGAAISASVESLAQSGSMEFWSPDDIDKYVRHMHGGQQFTAAGWDAGWDLNRNFNPGDYRVIPHPPYMANPHLTGDPRSQNSGDIKTTFNIGGLHFYGLKDPNDAQQAGQKFLDYMKSKGVDPRVTGSHVGSFATSPSMPTPSGFHLNF